MNALSVERRGEVAEQRGLRARIHVEAELDVELRRVHAERNGRQHDDARSLRPRALGGANRDLLRLDVVGARTAGDSCALPSRPRGARRPSTELFELVFHVLSASTYGRSVTPES